VNINFHPKTSRKGNDKKRRVSLSEGELRQDAKYRECFRKLRADDKYDKSYIDDHILMRFIIAREADVRGDDIDTESRL
jgi:hypothetical protein